MSYANHAARPPTPPGGRSSINKFVLASRSTLPNLQQLYLDSAARRDAGASAVHGGKAGLHSRSGSLADLAALHKLLEGKEGQYEWARRGEEELEALSSASKSGTLLSWFYARQNSILDSWNEVDVILFSPFPAAILERFASQDQVRESAERKQARKAVTFYDPTTTTTTTTTTRKDTPTPTAAGPLDFVAGSKRKSAAPPPRRGLSVSPCWPSHSTAEPGSSPSNGGTYGSLSESEALVSSEPSLARGRRYSGKTLADLFDNVHFQAEPPRDTRLDMPMPLPNENKHANGSASHGRDVSDHAAQESYADADADPDADSEHPPASAATNNDFTLLIDPSLPGDSEVESEASQQERSASIAAHVHNPDGKRERERKRLMAHVPGLAEKDQAQETEIQVAINVNLAANVALLVGKILACLSSRSISLFASLVDSALDLLSTLIIFGTSRLIAHRSFQTVYKYPVGKRRFEPLGVVIFAVLMIASFLQVLLESATRLWGCLQGDSQEIPSLPLAGIAIMLITVVLKAVMWVLYRRSRSSGVRAVAQDAENDVVFNIVSLTFPRLGQLLKTPALDPIGGILLSLYIIHEWVETLVEQVTKLSGKACGSEEIARALYLITRFKDVESVSGLEVYHAGDGMIIEADVVLPYDLSLKEAHDVGEVLTFALECLTDVERAYVHLDYNAHGPMGHLAQRG